MGKGGLKPHSPTLSQPGACRRPRQVPRVLSCRTATVWKTLCPFWGEEYQVHLPPTFHSVAFYVMDEDALRWVEPQSSAGAQTPPPVPLWPISPLGLLVTASSFQPGGRGSPGDPEGAGFGCAVSVCVDSLCSHHITRVHMHWACAHARGCKLGNRPPERRAWHVCGHVCQSTCGNISHAHERAYRRVMGPAPWAPVSDWSVSLPAPARGPELRGRGSWAPRRAPPSSGSLSTLQPGRRHREGLPYQGHPGYSA